MRVGEPNLANIYRHVLVTYDLDEDKDSDGTIFVANGMRPSLCLGVMVVVPGRDDCRAFVIRIMGGQDLA